tara:strand:+ start:3597 stop:4025 length:429 start_codon:yes stop_codon:yes gene_type:complete
MALYHAMGNALVTQDEIDSKYEPLVKFSRGKLDEVAFQSGRILRHEPRYTISSTNGEDVPFEDIGMGKPLLVQLRHVYRGEHPSGWKPHKQEMLVTSAMKSIAKFNAQPRAINFLTDEIGEQTGFSYVAAADQGLAPDTTDG